MNRRRLPIFVTLVLGSSAASAGLVTIDPNSFAAGTDISNATYGVTLSSAWHVGAPGDGSLPVILDSSPIFATACSDGSYNCSTIAGSNVFGHDVHAGWQSTVFAYEGAAAAYIAGEPRSPIFNVEVFRADFSSATNYAQLVVGGAHNADYPRVDFWDTTGALLGTCASLDSGLVQSPGCTVVNIGDPSSSAPGYKEPWLISLTSSSYNIGFVTSGGWAGGQFVTQLTYNRVPEPGTLGLMLVGVVGAALRRRRQAASA